MKDDKKVKTTLDSILQGAELRQFISAKQTWQNLKTSDAVEYRLKLYQIGQALNTLYIQGDKKGMKKPAITDMVREHFIGLNRFERSELRRLAHNAYDIECFVIAYDVHSISARRLLQNWTNQVDKNIVEARKKANKVKGIKVDEKTGKPEVVINRTTKLNKVMADRHLKEGIEPNAITPGKQVTTQEFCMQFNLIHNGFIRRFNNDEFNAEQLNELERIMTNSLMHMNDSASMDKLIVNVV